MIIVTGAAGFIGSNIICELNKLGKTNILAVDDLTQGQKYRNIVDATLMDYMDAEVFITRMGNEHAFEEPIEAIFHQGACSDTTEWNGRYVMENNYEYSKTLLKYCLEREIPFIYASSAAVYGGNDQFSESAKQQFPLNVYGYSKWLFDQYVISKRASFKSQVVGLRYFNVYGPREQHKGPMASVAFHFTQQLQETGTVKLFVGTDGYADGEQLRDFVFVEDIAKVNLWFLQNQEKSGIFNVGTGKARSFNDVANTLIQLNGGGKLQYIPFPEHLKGSYQSFTQADISALRSVGCQHQFHTLEAGLAKYAAWLAPSVENAGSAILG